MNSERRFCKAYGEVRATSQDGQKVITGTAIRYSKLSSTMRTSSGTFRERVLPGPCRSLAQNGFRNVTCLWNHDANFPLASVNSGTLKLSEDSRGLHYEALLGDTSYANDLHNNVSRGVVNGSSFGFLLDGKQGDDDWQERALTDEEEADDSEDDMDLFGVQQDDVIDDYDSVFARGEKRSKCMIRTIKNFRTITDVSPVTFPAYSSASVKAAVRAMTTVTLPADVLRKIMEQQEEPQKKHDDARARRRNLLGTVLG